MEFLPGAFESEWERRRAALLHELQIGKTEEVEWDLPRRGGVARLEPGLSGQHRRHHDRGVGLPPFRRGHEGSGRPARIRFAALARGSQPAVVKLASYGAGARAASMMVYVSRGGELAVENEIGERVSGKAALAEMRSEWEPLFDNRTASRDIGVFHVVAAIASNNAGVGDQDALVREILRAGFGDRHFVYAIKDGSSQELNVSGVLVLRDSRGERLAGDSKAASNVQERLDRGDFALRAETVFRFHGYGNGVEYGTARIRDLVDRFDGNVRNETGRLVADARQAGNLVQKEWRNELHSRKGRDVMHLIASARAGTDAAAFQDAVRDFLGDQFAGHRYVFAMHDPAGDPKETSEGGKRPHIHAHAIVTMRSTDGIRVETSPRVFREWRVVMAEKAREHGIDMEMTDRREFASAPAYTRNQARPVRYAGRTEHEGTSEAARVRYEAKRINQRQAPGSSRSTMYANAAAEIWRELAVDGDEIRVLDYARSQIDRILLASQQSQLDLENSNRTDNATVFRSNMVLLREFIKGDEADMREMTRPEFEAYEARVETVLSTVERSLPAREREEFDEIAAAAREVVGIRREYLESTEQQAETAREPPVSDNEAWDLAVAKHGDAVVVRGNDILIEIETAREAIDRAEDQDRDPASAQAELQRQLERAARLAVGGNTYLREVSETDQVLHRAIEGIERPEQKTRPDSAQARDSESTGTTGEPVHGSEDAGVRSGDGDLPGSTENDADQLRSSSQRYIAKDHAQHAADDRSGQRGLMPDHAAVARPSQTEERAEPRSDPPQQIVPRLEYLEREIADGHERDHDDREP